MVDGEVELLQGDLVKVRSHFETERISVEVRRVALEA